MTHRPAFRPLLYLRPLRHLLAVLLLTAALPPSAALAHRVNIFAWVEGPIVRTESYFTRERKVRDGRLEVRDAASGEVLLRGKTDAEGLYAFTPPVRARSEKLDLLLVVEAGEGHRGEWLVRAEEYAGSSSAPLTAEAEGPIRDTLPTEENAGTDQDHVHPAPEPVGTGSMERTIERAVSRAVNKALDERLAPVNRALAELREPGPGLREVLGGIGWIFGLVGVAAWVRSRKSPPEND